MNSKNIISLLLVAVLAIVFMTSGIDARKSKAKRAAEATLKRCQALGDPHYKTFNGKFDFYGVGDYVFAQTEDKQLVIHTRTGKWNKASVNTAVAVKVEGNRIFEYDVVSDKFYLDKVPTKIQVGQTVSLGSKSSVKRVSKTSFVVSSNGSVLSASYARSTSYLKTGSIGHINLILDSPKAVQYTEGSLCTRSRVDKRSVLPRAIGLLHNHKQRKFRKVPTTKDFPADKVKSARSVCRKAGISVKKHPNAFKACVKDQLLTGKKLGKKIAKKIAKVEKLEDKKKKKLVKKIMKKQKKAQKKRIIKKKKLLKRLKKLLKKGSRAAKKAVRKLKRKIRKLSKPKKVSTKTKRAKRTLPKRRRSLRPRRVVIIKKCKKSIRRPSIRRPKRRSIRKIKKVQKKRAKKLARKLRKIKKAQKKRVKKAKKAARRAKRAARKLKRKIRRLTRRLKKAKTVKAARRARRALRLVKRRARRATKRACKLGKKVKKVKKILKRKVKKAKRAIRKVRRNRKLSKKAKKIVKRTSRVVVKKTTARKIKKLLRRVLKLKKRLGRKFCPKKHLPRKLRLLLKKLKVKIVACRKRGGKRISKRRINKRKVRKIRRNRRGVTVIGKRLAKQLVKVSRC